MAYITLYRKYRPQTFNEVVGQKHIIATLQSAIDNNKIAHAYLFCGPRGTGKTTVARLIAKAANCSGENRPCGKCESCLAIQAGNHPDIVEIDAASNNGVDEIRDLVEKVKYAPLSAKYKIYIIDEVHMLTSNAFNALLKTLEDPPSHVIFILATTEAFKVLPTIISRCQRFDFLRIDHQSLVEKMEEVTAKENLECEEGLLDEIAILAEGGMRDALSILDQLTAFCGNKMDITSLHKVYGLLSSAEKISILENIFDKNSGEILTAIEKINGQSLDIRRLTNELIEILKECIVYRLTKNVLLLNKCEESQIQNLCAKADNKKLFALIDLFLETAEKYKSASNANLYFETCLLKGLNLDDEQEKVEVEPAKEIITEEKAEAPVVETPEQKQEEKPDFEFLLSLLLRASRDYKAEVSEKWTKIEDYAQDVDYARIALALKQSEVFTAGDDFVIVKSDYEEMVLQINDEKNNEIGTKLLEELYGKPRKIFAIESRYSAGLIQDYKDLKDRDNPLEPAERFVFVKEEKFDKENPIFAMFGEDVEVVE